MIISFKKHHIDFNDFHSLSASDHAIIFHSADRESRLNLSHIHPEHIDSVCDLIADQYRQGTTELTLDHII